VLLPVSSTAAKVGAAEGYAVGIAVGATDGVNVGKVEGRAVGGTDGIAVGCGLGASVHAPQCAGHTDAVQSVQPRCAATVPQASAS